MELFIIFGGAYALYTVGMAIATHLDYREVNKKQKAHLRHFTRPPYQKYQRGGGRLNCTYYISTNQFFYKTMNTSNQTTEAIRNFFNDTEWEAIERALADFQDYGDEEAKIADSIGDKIYNLFN